MNEEKEMWEKARREQEKTMRAMDNRLAYIQLQFSLNEINKSIEKIKFMHTLNQSIEVKH